MHSPLPEVILFDIDGTLVDDDRALESAIASFHTVFKRVLELSLEDLTRCWRELLKLHYSRYLMGELTMEQQRRLRVQDLFRTTGRALTAADADEIFGVYEHFYKRAWIAFPDAAAALLNLQGSRLAVLSNGERKQQMQKLSSVGLCDYFSSVFTSSEIGVSKPQPQAFLTTCTRLQVEPGRCLYVGDELDVDARGAAAAGLRAIWLNRAGFRSISAHNGIEVVPTLSDLPARLTALSWFART